MPTVGVTPLPDPLNPQPPQIPQIRPYRPAPANESWRLTELPEPWPEAWGSPETPPTWETSLAGAGWMSPDQWKAGGPMTAEESMYISRLGPNMEPGAVITASGGAATPQVPEGGWEMTPQGDWVRASGETPLASYGYYDWYHGVAGPAIEAGYDVSMLPGPGTPEADALLRAGGFVAGGDTLTRQIADTGMFDAEDTGAAGSSWLGLSATFDPNDPASWSFEDAAALVNLQIIDPAKLGELFPDMADYLLTGAGAAGAGGAAEPTPEEATFGPAILQNYFQEQYGY